MEDACCVMKGREMCWGGKMSVELQNTMPTLSKAREFLNTHESYYSLIAGTEACGHKAADILWDTTAGNMSSLKNNRYSEDDVKKVLDFVTKWSGACKMILSVLAFQEISELQTRLKMLHEYKRNSEDPLGW